MRIYIWALLAALAACGGDDDSGGTLRDGGPDPIIPDGPESMPALTSFAASPSQLPAGVPTSITWTWTYATEPTVPEPTCSIDNGVGAVTKGQATEVTISAVTTFTLTCTNDEGTAQRQVVVGVPPVAPLLATFTATPSALTSGAVTNVTFSWTYSNNPSPAPTCTIDAGVGTFTSGATTSLTLPQARTFRLRCTNAVGTSARDVTVAANECSGGTAACDANATCTDTVDSYACSCNTGFVGNGDICSAQAACGVTPSLCDANATCIGGTQCACKTGYVGSGTAGNCQRLRFAFVTSTTGNGNLSIWSGATGSGLAAADAVCQARATAAGLPGTYIAWMSDSTNDAYCRVHGLTGKKASNCGLGALPVAAGPWVRIDGQPFAPTIDKLLAPTRAVYYPAIQTEFGTKLSTSERVYTGTDDNGVLSSAACSDWTSNLSSVRGAMGEVHGGGTSWTDQGATDPTCDTFGHLRCMEVQSGPALPPRHPTNAKKAFLTSVSGTGNLSSWPDANGSSQLAAADQICQARARYAGYANAANFKAWLTYSGTFITSRIFNSGFPYARPDGVLLGSSRSDLLDSELASAWMMTETNQYAAGNADTGGVWTGLQASGTYSSFYCSFWTSTSSSGTIGRHDLLDGRYVNQTTSACDQTLPLYCVED